MIENPTDKQLKTLKMIVYILTNKINGKQYVGQTINTFRGRYYGNWLNNISNDYLYRAIKKYGKENFSIMILQSNLLSIDELNYWEALYIKEFNTMFPNGYNLDSGGRKNKKFSQETKDKIAKGNAKTYEIEDIETGEIIKITNMLKYCRDNKLGIWGMKHLVSGKKIFYKEWILPGNKELYLSHISKKNEYKIKNNFFSLRDPVGAIHIFTSAIEFPKKHNITTGCIYSLINKKARQMNGWSLPETELKEYWIKDKNNKVFRIIEGGLRSFSIDHSLNPDSIKRVCSGEQADIYGWTKAEPPIDYQI